MVDRNIHLNRSGIEISGQTVPFLSGSAHYWRLERSKWQLILENFKDLGLPILQTYVPWSVHETSPGQFDFGEFSPNKDLGAFLDLCQEVGLYVFVRPGPHINAELSYFGYPKRLFENPENLSVSSAGHQVILPAAPRAFPAITYASEHFYVELGKFYDAFAAVVEPRLHPNGPVIGIQADNEMSFFFRTAAYDHDYSHWTREAYIAWLKENYENLENIRDAYFMRAASLSEIPMPTAFNARRQEDLPYYVDWGRFKEEMLHRPLSRMNEMLKDRGLDGLLTFHNYPVTLGKCPFNISRGEQDFHMMGVDFYHKKSEYALFKEQLLNLCGTSRFPISPEFSSGCYHVWAPLTLDDQVFTTLTALAYGLKGINFYMIVERERWYGSPIDRHGEYRKDYAQFYRALTRFIRQSGLFSMDRIRDVALLRCRDYDRLAHSADLLSPLPPLVTDNFMGAAERCHEGTFGFDYCIAIEHEQLFKAWYLGLTRAQIPFDVSDTEMPLERLLRYKALFLPSFDFMTRKVQDKLHQYVQNGGTLIMGPDVPALDATLKEYSTLDQYLGRPVHKLDCTPDTVVCNAAGGRIVMVNGLFGQDVKELDKLVHHIARFVQLRAVFPATGACETTAFQDPEGRKIVFVINPTDQLRRPQIHTGGGIKFRDMLTDEMFYGEESVPVFMEPFRVRPLEVIHAG